MPSELEKHLFELRSRLEIIDNPRKMIVNALKSAADILDARAGAVAILTHNRFSVELVHSDPRSEDWDLGFLGDFIRRRRPSIPEGLVVAQITRRGKVWGALAVKPREQPIDGDTVKALQKISHVLSERIGVWDDTRLRRLRTRIEHKIANRQEPKDIIYDILHGLRSLIRYDHSASFLIYRGASESLTLIAEQVAWKKGKSKSIGLKLSTEGCPARELAFSGVRLFKRSDDRWVDQQSNGDSCLVDLLDYNRRFSSDVPREEALIIAVVHTPDNSTGILRVASRMKDALGKFEVALIEQFIPLMSLSVQFLLKTWALKREILEAERKNALVDVARGVAHDVNNSLGSVLPLIQQIQDEALADTLDTETLRNDLHEIELGLRNCRRIFSGMLATAKAGDRSSDTSNLRQALDTSLDFVQNRLRRQSITVKISSDVDAPSIRGNHSDIARVFFNLFQNAIDAMPYGGKIDISAKTFENMIGVQISDSGIGIPSEILDEVTDAYVTTKADGYGIGLSVCRSIMWEIGGIMSISSTEGRGTHVYLQFPRAQSESVGSDDEDLENPGS
jgi:two-component system NtrC family sensor kinase